MTIFGIPVVAFISYTFYMVRDGGFVFRKNSFFRPAGLYPKITQISCDLCKLWMKTVMLLRSLDQIGLQVVRPFP